MRPEWQNHHTAIRQLGDQFIGDGFGGRCDNDALKGRALGDAGQTILGPHLDIVIAQRRQPLARGFRQGPIAFDADHLAREPREDGGLVA